MGLRPPPLSWRSHRAGDRRPASLRPRGWVGAGRDAAYETLIKSPPDEFAVRGREIYLHCPNGFARTKFTKDYFDSKLATTSTGRNWRTVLTLLDLASR